MGRTSGQVCRLHGSGVAPLPRALRMPAGMAAALPSVPCLQAPTMVLQRPALFVAARLQRYDWKRRASGPAGLAQCTLAGRPAP